MSPPLSAFIDGYDHVLLDLDGCVWVGDALTPDAGAALAALSAAGKGVMFVTNDARHTVDEFLAKFARLGLSVPAEQLITAGTAIQQRLAEDYPAGSRAVVLGSAAVHRHVRDAGLEVVNGPAPSREAVVAIVSGHEQADYAEIRDVSVAVMAGATLLATARDPTYPTAEGIWPGTGALVAAVETATGQEATVIGKPARTMIDVALGRLGPGRALFVGDRPDTDLAAAQNAGIDGAIVLTGSTSAAQAAAWQPGPVRVAATLAELVLDTPAAPGPERG